MDENQAYVKARINTVVNMIQDLWNEIKRIDIELNDLKNSFNSIQSNAQDAGNSFKKFTELARPETNDIDRNLEQKSDLEIFSPIDKDYSFGNLNIKNFYNGF